MPCRRLRVVGHFCSHPGFRIYVFVVQSAGRAGSMAGGLRANARTHVHNMTANFGRTCMPWGRKQSVWAGCSGGFFCVPGLFGLSADPSSHWMLVAFVAQAVLSVMSDYVATGRDSVWHGLDRWTATCMTVRAARGGVSPTRARRARGTPCALSDVSPRHFSLYFPSKQINWKSQNTNSSCHVKERARAGPPPPAPAPPIL